jgi:DNA-binding MarR family transcriptional regulator
MRKHHPLTTELAKALEIGKGTLGGLVDRLEENGYARRMPEPGDRRANRIIATSEGQNMLRHVEKSRKAIDDKIMAGVSRQERQQAEVVLRVLKKRLIAMDTIPGSRKPGRR